jgi:hypothetical protein
MSTSESIDRGSVVGRRISVLLGGGLLAALAAGCSSGVASVSVQSPAASTSSSGSADPSTAPASSPGSATSSVPPQSTAAATQPLPAGTRRNLPAGVFYLLAGRGLASLNLWQVTVGGRERQLTHNRRGFGIDAFDASAAGIILADGSSSGDDLARLTPQGPSLLRKTGGQLALLRGSSPDIRDDGMIGYVTPPSQSGSRTGGYFEIWTRRSFSGRGTVLLKQRHPLAGPVFGPHGQIAVEGWGGAGQKPSVLIYSGSGVRRLLTGINAIPSLVAWGEHAPALALAFPAHAAELLYLNGHRQLLPPGWQPLTWNPAGTELLMQSARALGIWSMSSPGRVTRIGPSTPGVQILQADWLTMKAPL